MIEKTIDMITKECIDILAKNCEDLAFKLWEDKPLIYKVNTPEGMMVMVDYDYKQPNDLQTYKQYINDSLLTAKSYGMFEKYAIQ